MARWTELPDAGARSVFAAYFAQVDRALAPLPRAEAEEIKAELEAHALDAMADSQGVGADHARSALAQLGEPDGFLPVLVTDRMRARAGRSFRPDDVFAAIARNSASGAAGLALSTIVGIGYAIAALAVVMGVLRMFSLEGVGAFRLHSGELFIGFDENVQGVDLLGIWFSPLAIAVGACLYFVLTWAFGRATVRQRAPIGRTITDD